MATDSIATVLSRRCSSCGALYPHDEAHVCPNSVGAATIELPAPGSVTAPFAATIEQKSAATEVLPAQSAAAAPLPDTVPLATSIRDPLATVDSPRPSSQATAPVGQPASAPPRPSTPVELVGLVLGDRYEIKERLSAGGMGVVYKARHIVLESPVAVKVLLRPQDGTAQRRFLQEAKVASAIRHPNTVYISDFGVLADGRSYLVMEFLQGPTLAKVLRSGPLEPVRACRIALQIAQGLQAVHARGIVHREVLKIDSDCPRFSGI